MNRWICVVLAACSGSKTAPPLPPPTVPADAATITDTVPVTIDPFVRPAATGKALTLAVGTTGTLGSFSVRFASNGHKHAVNGSTTGMYGFEIAKGDAKVALELRSDEPLFQVETVAHGALFVLDHRTYDEFSVVLVTEQAPVALSQDACLALIEDAAKRANMSDMGDSGYSTSDGIMWLKRTTWTAYCGVYTKRVWFGPPDKTNDDDKPKPLRKR